MNNYKEYALALNANSNVLYWINHNLVNHLKTNPEVQEEIEHIIDYLVSDEAPKTFVKMSYDEAKKNTDKWVATLHKRAMGIDEKPEDTEVVLDFNDGFKIVKLIGQAAYQREGLMMGHCVGSYYGNGKEIYSLRDKNNMSHCTMEKDQQIKGKGNGNIHPKYIHYVVKFLEYAGMTVGDSEMAHLGYINVERFKDQLAKETKYFNDKYVSEDETLFDKEGKEFASLELFDIKPLVKQTFETELKIGFDLHMFVPLAIDFLFRHTKSTVKDDLNQSKDGDSAKLAASGDYAQLAASGHSAQLAASGHSAKLAASGDYAQLAASGHSAKLAASGDYAKLAASGDYAQLAASGDSAQLAASGDYAQLAASGHSAKLAASGHSAKLAASGDYAQLAASGDYAQLAASGHSAKLAASGDYGVGANISYNGSIKGKIGNWITLAEYDSYGKPLCVKSAKIDGKKLKEDVYYRLENGKFVEVKL